MSKKGKRLEKENEALKRQKEATAANIIRMAEERQDWKSKIDVAEKKTEKLMSIIQQMQQQGRKIPPGANAATAGPAYSNTHQPAHGHEEDGEGTDDAEPGDESEFDDDTEEESPPTDSAPARVAYGPERPPAVPQATTNGH